MYSITNPDSFAEMQSFKDQIQANKKAGEEVPIALVGNKVDLEDQRAVTSVQGEELLKKWKGENSDSISDFMFLETSAMVSPLLLCLPPSCVLTDAPCANPAAKHQRR